MAVTQGDTIYNKHGTPIAQRNNFMSVFNAQVFLQAGIAELREQFGSHGLNAVVLADRRQTTFNYDPPGQGHRIFQESILQLRR